VEMPFNFAFLDIDAAEDIINKYDYNHYVMSGHSLGGVMAAQYVNETNNTDALILLGAYSTKQIDKPVLSVYGSQDKVLNMETYRQNLPLISENLSEAVIDGGNHAQMGNYGAQQGDGMAKISPQKQQSETAEEIINFINELN
jgi:pimeloyl-ACP methyl ester carboxylesterase